MAQAVEVRTTLVDLLTRFQATDIETKVESLCWKILESTGYYFDFSPTPLERIEGQLKVRVVYSPQLNTDAELHRDENRWIVKLPRTAHYRNRFSRAHEIAHIIVKSILDRDPNPNLFIADLLESRRATKRLESLCNRMAAEFIAPKWLFCANTFVDLRKLLLNISTSEAELSRKTSQSSEDLLLPGFTLKMLFKLSGSLRVSLNALLPQLHHSRILDEAETGFILSEESFNPKSGGELGLRVKAVALPSWGFIPNHIRLSRIGLLSAIANLSRLRRRQTVWWEDTLFVRQKQGSGDSAAHARWKDGVQLKSCGEHAIDSTFLGNKVLITSFQWPSPTRPG